MTLEPFSKDLQTHNWEQFNDNEIIVLNAMMNDGDAMCDIELDGIAWNLGQEIKSELDRRKLS